MGCGSSSVGGGTAQPVGKPSTENNQTATPSKVPTSNANTEVSSFVKEGVEYHNKLR